MKLGFYIIICGGIAIFLCMFSYEIGVKYGRTLVRENNILISKLSCEDLIKDFKALER